MSTNRRLSGATVLLSALASTNAAGQVSNWATAVNGNWSDGTKWDAGVPFMAGQSAAFGLSGVYTATLNQNATIDDVQITNPDAILSISPAFTLGLLGPSSINDGRIQLNAVGSATNSFLRIDNATALAGSGEIWMQTSGDNSQIVGLGILTNDTGHTIRGVGEIRAQTFNNGTIAADVGVSVSGNTLDVFADIENNALMEGRANSVLNLSGVTIDQTFGGSIVAANLGNVSVTSAGAAVLFGTIESAGSGEFNVNSGAEALLSGVVNNGTIDVLFGGTLTTDAIGLENNGIIELNRAGSATNSVFRVSQSADLSGTGSLNMKSQGSDDTQVNTDAGAVLTHGVDHEIRGVGYINAELVNNGIITADIGVSVSGGTLVMQGSPKTNNDLMIAAPGSVLQFTGVTLDQLGGGELVTTGGEIRLSNTTVLGGVYNTFGGLLRSLSGTNLLSGMQLNGPMILDLGSTVQIDAEGMINNGVIQLNPLGSATNTSISFTESADLLGTGEIQMRSEGVDDTQINTAVGETMTHGSSHLIRGVGQLNAAIVNNGEVRADVSVSVSGSRLTARVNDKVNNGLMVAAPSSTLLFTGIAVDQTGGGMIVADGGTVQLTSTSITGGDYVATGAGSLTTVTGTSTVAGVVFDGPSTVALGTTLQIGTGGLENNGIMQVNPLGSASNGVVEAIDSVGLTGTGEIRLRSRGSDDSQINTAPGMTLTQGAGHTIRGVGYVNAALVNNGTISADGSVSVSGNALDLQGENKTNAGLVSAEVGSVLNIESITLTQTGSGSIVANNGSVIFSSGATLVGGPVSSTGTGSFAVTGSATFDGVTLNAPGTVNLGSTLNVASASLVNNALITVNPFFSASDGVIAFAGPGLLTGSGEVNLTATSPNSVLTAAGTVTNGSGHTLSGRGRITAPFFNEGILAPGTNDIGTLSATAGATLGAGGIYRVEISGNSADRLTVTGTAALGGTLDLALGGAAVLTNNTGAIIVSGTSVTGTFGTINHLQAGKLITRVVYEPTQVRVLVRCIADTNLDGAVTAADFSAWISAFNSQAVVADQNLDGNVSPADFSAWIANFNQGCP